MSDWWHEMSLDERELFALSNKMVEWTGSLRCPHEDCDFEIPFCSDKIFDRAGRPEPIDKEVANTPSRSHIAYLRWGALETLGHHLRNCEAMKADARWMAADRAMQQEKPYTEPLDYWERHDE